MGFRQTYESILEHAKRPIEIYEGFLAHEYTNILPVKRGADEANDHVSNDGEEISISHAHLWGYLGDLLNRYYDSSVQIGDHFHRHEGYDEYGWNFYTVEQIQQLLTDLAVFADIAEADPFDERCLPYFAWWRRDIPVTEAQNEEYVRVKAKRETDFYRRFHARMMRMIENRGDFDLIMFEGP